MIITSPEPNEYGLIFDSFANSYRKSPWAGTVPNHLWPLVSRTLTEELLARGSVVLVGVTPVEGADPGVRRVVGYSISQPDRKVLHYLYVKRDYRGLGMGRKILNATCPEGQWYYTCRTRASSGFLGERFRWDPIQARVK